MIPTIILVILLCILSGLIGFLISNEMTIRTLEKMREALERGEFNDTDCKSS